MSGLTRFAAACALSALLATPALAASQRTLSASGGILKTARM